MGHRMKGDDFILRRAQKLDLMQIYEWRNQEEIVSLSRTGKRVDLNEHRKWFLDAINSSKILIIIIENSYKPIGQIRFDDRKNHSWEISIYLEKEECGKGRGENLIRAGCRELRSREVSEEIFALIKVENKRSIKAFKKAGFKEVPQKAMTEDKKMVKLINTLV